MEAKTKLDGSRARRPSMAPGLLALAVLGSPFDPHPLPDGRAFFEGWYLRVTDYDHNRSFAVVLGSLQPQGKAELTENWAALIVNDAPATSAAILTEQIFPPNTTVTTGEQKQ